MVPLAAKPATNPPSSAADVIPPSVVPPMIHSVTPPLSVVAPAHVPTGTLANTTPATAVNWRPMPTADNAMGSGNGRVIEDTTSVSGTNPTLRSGGNHTESLSFPSSKPSATLPETSAVAKKGPRPAYRGCKVVSDKPMDVDHIHEPERPGLQVLRQQGVDSEVLQIQEGLSRLTPHEPTANPWRKSSSSSRKRTHDEPSEDPNRFTPTDVDYAQPPPRKIRAANVPFPRTGHLPAMPVRRRK